MVSKYKNKSPTSRTTNLNLNTKINIKQTLWIKSLIFYTLKKTKTNIDI